MTAKQQGRPHAPPTKLELEAALEQLVRLGKVERRIELRDGHLEEVYYAKRSEAPKG
jgi:hypothetical protein